MIICNLSIICLRNFGCFHSLKHDHIEECDEECTLNQDAKCVRVDL